MTGRAWPSNGAGGTLNAKGTGPGPYYVLAQPGVPLVGLAGDISSDPLERAVGYAVTAIQRALNRLLFGRIKVDGVFGHATHDAALRFQVQAKLTQDGIVGPQTCRALFARPIQNLSTDTAPACAVAGLIANESGFDPGAVGYSDPNDKGLVQLNLPSHPDWTEAEAFAPLLAIDFAVGLLESAMHTFDGNLRDAVISYNLGAGGTRSWIAAGRPDHWTPAGSSSPRDVKGYADRILSSCP